MGTDIGRVLGRSQEANKQRRKHVERVRRQKVTRLTTLKRQRERALRELERRRRDDDNTPAEDDDDERGQVENPEEDALRETQDSPLPRWNKAEQERLEREKEEQRKVEKAAKIDAAEKRRHHLSDLHRKRTRRGQPVMKHRVKMLLDKLENGGSQS
uniref:rRNA-processing protein FYV7 n=1 Tax=Compsopogon caeruleus TaxID=31354 RepID=A0A7S1XFZ4_9RHOD|mmetsp:Transcript_5284/g.10844  ORF Transcript_5284/g.10844 Transcript_5284/m.10844 type:complete len:157 (+) Transcript_5284:134-604(+)